MKKLFFIILILCNGVISAQDTFSIVAVDTLTGEIGSAGASCIDDSQIEGGALIISDVIPGRGAIHTQSYWNSTNQQNAHARMVEGMSPEEIIQWLSTHDAQNNPAVRQYGVVDFDSAGHARSAGFTGVNCMDYKNHITGPNYSIQGNILLGQQILDSIESRFLNTQGTLAEKMMAALQGANVVGADTRCTNNGTSSLSAFIRIARPGDQTGSFYCDLNVPEVPEGMEPIDSLQTLFNAWWEMVVGVRESSLPEQFVIYPNPAGDVLMVSSRQSAVVGIKNIKVLIINMVGEQVKELIFNNKDWGKKIINIGDIPPGIYFISFFHETDLIQSQKLIILR